MKKEYADALHRIAYNMDASHIDHDMPVHVFLPENEEELKTIVQQAIDENKKITLRGAGTNLVGSCLPTPDCFVIDMSKFDTIGELKENSITVQTGVIGDQLNDYLSATELFFPVVIGSHATAQIGAMISTNGAGMRAIKYGKMENRVQSLKILTINKDKKIEIKNVDATQAKDFLGSEGILGIILEATLSLTPKTKQRSIDFLSFETIDDLIKQVQIYQKDLKNISALEMINPQIAQWLDLGNAYHLLVEYENAEQGEIKDSKVIEELRKKRDACYSIVVSKGFDYIEDPQVNIENMQELLQRFEINQIPVFGHIGIGVLHPHFHKEDRKLIDEMYALVQKLGGKVSGEHGIGIKKKQYLSTQEKEKFSNIKRKYDPNNIFGGENIVNK